MPCLFLHAVEREDFLGGGLLLPRQNNSLHQQKLFMGLGTQVNDLTGVTLIFQLDSQPLR